MNSNVIPLPTAISDKEKSRYLNEKNWENLFSWFSSCIEANSYDQSIVNEVECLGVVDSTEVELLATFLLNKVALFYQPTLVSEDHNRSREFSDASNPIFEHDFSKIIQVQKSIVNHANELGWEWGKYFSPELAAEASAWPTDDEAQSIYHESPLKIIHDYIDVHYPGKDSRLNTRYLSKSREIKNHHILYDVFNMIAAKIMGMQPVKLWNEFDSRSLSFIVLMWAMIRKGKYKQGEMNTLLERAMMSWSHGALQVHNTKDKQKSKEAQDIVRFLLATCRELAPLSGEVKSFTTDDTLGSIGPIFNDDLFSAMLITFIEILSHNPSTNRQFIEMAVGIHDYEGLPDLFYLDHNGIDGLNNVISVLNQYSIEYEGKPKFFPFGYYWAWIHAVTDLGEINAHFDLQLESICFDSFGCDFQDKCFDVIYNQNRLYIKAAEQALSQCSPEVSEALVLMLLHRNVIWGGTLEPWVETAPKILKIVSSSNDVYSKFVWKLTTAYIDWCSNRNDHALVVSRLRRIQSVCKPGTPKISILRGIENTYPLTKEEAENDVREKIGATFNKLHPHTKKLLVDSEYTYRTLRFHTKDALDTWNGIITQPIQAIEHEIGNRWSTKYAEEGNPPELGTFAFSLLFVLKGKKARNERHERAIETGRKLLEIFPRLNDLDLSKKLMTLKDHRNLGSHGGETSIEKIEDSRKLLYQDGFLREFFEALCL